MTFSNRFKVKPDLVDRPGGDGGKDFEINGFRIDIKAVARGKHDYLLCVYGKPVSDIVVLCEVDLPNNKAWLKGWEYGEIIKQGPTITFKKKNWGIHKDELRPMSELWKLFSPTPCAGDGDVVG